MLYNVLIYLFSLSLFGSLHASGILFLEKQLLSVSIPVLKENSGTNSGHSIKRGLGVELRKFNYSGTLSLKAVIEAMQSVLDDLNVSKYMKRSLIEFKNKGQLAHYYLSSVRVLNPKNKNKSLPLTKEEWIPEDRKKAYVYAEGFESILDEESECFRQFTADAQKDIREFNKVLAELMKKIEEWEKDK